MLALFLIIAGLIIGLGALTVIDWHGFLAQKSGYWTEATTRTHQVTKPLIWTGLILATIGGVLFYKDDFGWIAKTMLAIWPFMVLNGMWLSFSVSPYLLKREKEGHANEILPLSWRRKIFISFIFSFLCWWGEVALLVIDLNNKL